MRMSGSTHTVRGDASAIVVRTLRVLPCLASYTEPLTTTNTPKMAKSYCQATKNIFSDVCH